jgi:cellulose synthase (UDP-forming)
MINQSTELNAFKIPKNWSLVAKIAAIFICPKIIDFFLYKYNDLFIHYRMNVISAFILSLIYLVIPVFIRVDKIQYTRIYKSFYLYYPQLKKGEVNSGDIFRFLIQSVFLIIFKHNKNKNQNIKENTKTQLRKTLPFILRTIKSIDQTISEKILSLLGKDTNKPSVLESLAAAKFWEKPLIRNSILVLALFMCAVFITVPFSLEAQAMFMSLILITAYALKGIKGRMPTMIMVTLSVSTSTRYLWWRYTETLNWGDPVALWLGIGLLAAETYAWMVLILGFFQTIRPLNRKPAKMPKNIDDWPCVDVYIPTYNEPLSVVRLTAIAATSLDWPRDRLNIYILDDGKRSEFKEFAEEIGIGYLDRPDNSHAKAGNLNHAMAHTTGEYIAIFDCDHVPVRSFLQMTMGSFLKDDKVCLVQTPHHFFSADPFERNLGNFTKTPNENMLFYGLIQDGNDMWDATFFCGSCAILKREALESIGGFAFETVTEDAHTALRMQREGYKTVYINLPQAAGLATESLSAHIGQRIRWARGMAQIFRIDNPIIGKGLDIGQRLCYLNAMLHFLSGVPRIVFLTAPLAMIYFNAYIIYAPFLAIMVYVIPTLLQVKITNSRIQGKYRFSFWGEVYESVLAWYILKPTTVALINPNKGKFNVTEKGGLVEQEHFDWTISKPYVVLLILNLIGLIIGSFRLFFGDISQIGVLLISMAWAGYNLMILGAAVAVAAESKQVRHAHRISAKFPAIAKLKNGHTVKVTVSDFSDSGIGITTEFAHLFQLEDKIELMMTRGYKQFSFPTYVCNSRNKHVGLILDDLTKSQSISYVQCTFSRADAWLDWQENFKHDKPSDSFKEVRDTSVRGFKNLIVYAPSKVKPIINKIIKLIVKISSFMPKKPKLEENKSYG